MLIRKKIRNEFNRFIKNNPNLDYPGFMEMEKLLNLFLERYL